jgi:glyoxylase-like metal-dependent hydrolase (beta-lactamase superfamily II)
MHLGDIEVRHLHAGTLCLDGGAMFGVVPKTLWEKKSTPDERNRIRLAVNVLLVRAAGKNILIETGNGAKWDGKLRQIYGIPEGDGLQAALGLQGMKAENIDMVINTHLHFDHAGGNTIPSGERDVPAFPNARYLVQREELEHARHPNERDRASYFSDRFEPIIQAGLWELVDGDAEIVPGISVTRIPGHNQSIQAVKLTGGGKTLFFAADLVPTRHHLPLPWIMAYDLYPLQTLETKRKWVSEIARQNWILAFGHDPDLAAATLHERNGKIEFEPVDLNR